MNYHLLKLDMTYTDLDNAIIILLVILLIHLVALFVVGLLQRNDSDIITPLYVVIHLIYCILNEIITLIIGVGSILLGNVGGIFFIILCVILFFIGIFRLVDDIYDDIFIFGAGKIPEWISDNYYAKQNYYNELNDSYKKFKQYNEEII
jgi:hypothetical protein